MAQYLREMPLQITKMSTVPREIHRGEKLNTGSARQEDALSLRDKDKERERHEAVCMFRGFKCGMERCPWIGKFEEIERH